MRRDILTSVLSLLILTLILGVAYPLATTGIAQVAFPGRADGSKVEAGGKVVGSRLIGQDFSRPVLGKNGKPKKDADGNPVLAADPRYFQSRPSATGYSANVTYFNNLGPNSKELSALFAENLKTYLDRERAGTPDLRASDVPPDAVQTSASGVDPHISKDNAHIQAARVARVRHLPLKRVLSLVKENTDDRGADVLGDPGVNVLELNLALDREAA